MAFVQHEYVQQKCVRLRFCLLVKLWEPMTRKDSILFINRARAMETSGVGLSCWMQSSLNAGKLPAWMSGDIG